MPIVPFFNLQVSSLVLGNEMGICTFGDEDTSPRSECFTFPRFWPILTTICAPAGQIVVRGAPVLLASIAQTHSLFSTENGLHVVFSLNSDIDIVSPRSVCAAFLLYASLAAASPPPKGRCFSPRRGRQTLLRRWQSCWVLFLEGVAETFLILVQRRGCVARHVSEIILAPFFVGAIYHLVFDAAGIGTNHPFDTMPGRSARISVFFSAFFPISPTRRGAHDLSGERIAFAPGRR